MSQLKAVERRAQMQRSLLTFAKPIYYQAPDGTMDYTRQVAWEIPIDDVRHAEGLLAAMQPVRFAEARPALMVERDAVEESARGLLAVLATSNPDGPFSRELYAAKDRLHDALMLPRLADPAQEGP